MASPGLTAGTELFQDGCVNQFQHLMLCPPCGVPRVVAPVSPRVATAWPPPYGVSKLWACHREWVSSHIIGRTDRTILNTDR
jgi:hypothetical protein